MELESESTASSGADVLVKIIGTLIGIAIVIIVVVWLLANIVLPILLLNSALVCVVAALQAKEKRPLFGGLALAGAAYMLADITNGWFSANFVKNVVHDQTWITVFVWVNAAAAAGAAWLLVQPLVDSGKAPSEREKVWYRIAAVVLVLVPAAGVLLIYHFFATPKLAGTSSASIAASFDPSPSGGASSSAATPAPAITPMTMAASQTNSASGHSSSAETQLAQAPKPAPAPEEPPVVVEASIATSPSADSATITEAPSSNTTTASASDADLLAPPSAEKMMEDAFRSGNWEGVVINASSVLAASPAAPRASKLMGEALLRDGREHDSLPYLTKAIDLGEEVDFPVSYNGGASGYVYMRTGRVTVSRNQIQFESSGSIESFSVRPDEVAAVATEPAHAHRLRLRVFVKNTRAFFGRHVGPEKENKDFFFYSQKADAAGNGPGGTGFEVDCRRCDASMDVLFELVRHVTGR